MNTAPRDPSGENPQQSWLTTLPDTDRNHLNTVLQKLLVHGSLLGNEEADRSHYSWAWENRPCLEDFLELLGFQAAWEIESRLLQVIPTNASFLLRLKLDATLVFLALWYVLDEAIQQNGEVPPIVRTVEQLNDVLRTQFEPLKRGMPKATRLHDILQLARQKNLVRLELADSAEESRVHILPTIRRVIPFQDLESWTKHMESLATNETDSRGNEAPEEDT